MTATLFVTGRLLPDVTVLGSSGSFALPFPAAGDESMPPAARDALQAIQGREVILCSPRRLLRGRAHLIGKGQEGERDYFLMFDVQNRQAVRLPLDLPEQLLLLAPEVFEFEVDRSAAPMYHDWCLDHDWPKRAALLTEQMENQP